MAGLRETGTWNLDAGGWWTEIGAIWGARNGPFMPAMVHVTMAGNWGSAEHKHFGAVETGVEYRT